MKSKNAAEAATAKPCTNSETVKLPVELVDTVLEVTDHTVSVLLDYRDSLMRSGASQGVWIGGEDAALDFATVSAAIDGARNLIVELGGIEIVEMPSGAEIAILGSVPEAKESLIDVVLAEETDTAGRLRFQSIAEHNQLPNETDPAFVQIREHGQRWGMTVGLDRSRTTVGRVFKVDTNGERGEEISSFAGPNAVRAANDLVEAHNSALDPEAEARVKLAARDAGKPKRIWKFHADPSGGRMFVELPTGMSIASALKGLDSAFTADFK